MRLEEVSATLRPRSPWESVDLGFAMVRRDFKRLLLAWALTVIPLWALLLVASRWVPIGWSLVAIWWLKPIYDRVPLFILSRSLFGAPPTLREVLRAWPGMIFRDFFRLIFLRVPWLLFWPRFGWARSLLLPTIDLEGQKGVGFSRRQQVLLDQAGGTARGLAIFCGVYELILVFGLLTLGASFSSDPQGAIEMGTQIVDTAFRRGEAPTWLLWSLIGGYLLAVTVVEMFYVGGGFGLYLNCRTHLEGWDVEIVFRRLAQRLAKVTAGAAAALMLVGVFAPSASAADHPSREAEAIKRIKSHEDFKVNTVKEHRQIGGSKEDSIPRGSTSLAGLGDVIFGLVITAAIVGLIWLIYTNRHVFTRRAGSKIEPRAGPRTVMGLDVSPDSLPADIVAAARERWAAGDARAALSLLYRGSLVWLVHVARLRIRESDTEGDCVRNSSQLPQAAQRDYFSILTGQWVGAAYAERLPDSAKMEQLLAEWPFQRVGGRGT